MLSHRDRVHAAKLALPPADLLLLGTARSWCLHLTSTCVCIFVLNKTKQKKPSSFSLSSCSVLPCCFILPPAAPLRLHLYSHEPVHIQHVSFRSWFSFPPQFYKLLSRAARCQTPAQGEQRRNCNQGPLRYFLPTFLLLAGAGWIPARRPTGAERDLITAPYQIFSRH